MRPTNSTRLFVLFILTTLIPVSARGQLNGGAFQGLPESPVTSLGAADFNLVRPAGSLGPNLNWLLDATTLAHSFGFNVDSGTGFLNSHFYTTMSLWSWSSENTSTPVAMRLTEAGRLTLGGTWQTADGPIVLDPNPGGPTISVAGGITAQRLEISGEVHFSGIVSLGGGAITSFGNSLLGNANAAAARATLGAAAQSDIPLFWKYVVETQNPNLGALGSPASTGSGVTYWPNRNTFLLLDNNAGSARVLEFDRAGSLQRTISLVGFGDPEDIHWISGDTFVISQERNSSSVDEIDVIDLPTTGTSVNISTATRRLKINTSTFTSSSNSGIEGVALVGNDFYFATEKGPSKPSSSEWNVWKVPNAGSGTITVTPKKAFRLTGLLYGRALDVSGMATDGTYLWLLSHEGAVANGPSRVLKTTLDGRLIEENMLPCFSDGSIWLQAEGIELFTDTDGKVKIALSGEVGNNGTGVDFMVLSPP